MNNNPIKKLQVYLNRKEKSAYILTRLAKTGYTNATKQELDMVNTYVYEAYQPLLDRSEVTKKGFLQNAAHTALYRQQYAEYIRNMMQVKRTDILDDKGKLNIETATKELQSSNKDWVNFQETLLQNNEEPEIKKKLQGKVNYNNYVILPEYKRKQLIRIAADKNRTADKAVYEALESYIVEQEGASSVDYLDNQELREKYRELYENLKVELEAEGAKGKASYETPEEAIKRIAHAASSMLLSKKQTEGKVELPEVPSLEELSKLEPIKLSNMELMYINGVTQMTNQILQDEIKKSQEEVDKLARFNARHKQEMDEMWAEFHQRQAERNLENIKKFEELSKKYSENTSDEEKKRK